MKTINKYRPQHINYALVEGVRPPMYSAMKYWGRKPNNIWSDYISHYCPAGGVVLDPFVGSGITAFECARLGRKVIATDLNPLSMFVMSVEFGKFNEKEFTEAANAVLKSIGRDKVYQKHYLKNIKGKKCTIYNFIWEGGVVKRVRVKNGEGEGLDLSVDASDISNSKQMKRLVIPYWYPQNPFPQNPSISHNFLSKIGGTTMDALWTRRNLYVLAKIFDAIKRQKNANIRMQLAFAFIHTLHLVSKMVVPRGKKGNRNFSGSWGRADYMIRNRSMEQNPLVIFRRSCFDKQGVVTALTDANKTVGARRISAIRKLKSLRSLPDINCGIVDVADLRDYYAENSVDFILTDPPYGGLVQYMDLSMVWLIWLSNLDPKYTPNTAGEITYKRGIISRDAYRKRLNNAFRVMHYLLKPEHYLVVTFHNQDIKEWNDFVCAIREAGFTFEKVTHQYNRRSGESNVSNPYGTTGSDFYIRCRKSAGKKFGEGSHDKDLGLFVVNQTRKILTERGEPTHFEFVLNGLLPAMLQAGYLEPDQPSKKLMSFLLADSGETGMFTINPARDKNLGPVIWFRDPSSSINHMNISLTDRVDATIRALLRRDVSVKYDDVVAEIFKQFPNGQTPDHRGLLKVLEKYAEKSSGKWKLKDVIERECTEHTLIISLLCKMAKKCKVLSYVGKRERSEPFGKGKLSDIATVCDLSKVTGYNEEQLSRIGMIDSLWIDKSNNIVAAFEVENSTDFVGAVGRASNISRLIPKFMVIPQDRLKEFLRYSDPLFREGFRKNNWRYLMYDDINRLASAKVLTYRDIQKSSKKLI